MVIPGLRHLVVDPINHDTSVQTDLFGDPLPAPDIPVQRAVSRIESNDIDLMMTIADNAARCGYYVAGTTERSALPGRRGYRSRDRHRRR